jgi:hypothetical protein
MSRPEIRKFGMLLLVALFWGLPSHEQLAGEQLADDEKKSESPKDEEWTSEDYEAICWSDETPEDPQLCREQLSIWSEDLMWLDSQLLVPEGQPLRTSDIDRFYGFQGERAAANRSVVLAFLAAWCYGEKGPQQPITEEELLKSSCAQNLPSLAVLGLSMDSTIDGINIDEDAYHGKDSSSTQPLRKY